MKNRLTQLLAYIILSLLPFITFASLKPITSNFLVITDIHLDQSDWFSMTINPSIPNPLNDLDPKTFKKLMRDIHQNIKNGTVDKPQFILILGDISGHLRLHAHSVINNESAVFHELDTIFSPTPIFYVFGNNDSLLANYGPFSDPHYPGQDKSPYDIAQSQGSWRNGFLSTGIQCKSKQIKFPCLIIEDSVNGYYSAYLNTKLRLIALNSVLFSVKRNRVSDNAATNQLAWLAAQLASAQKNHESVIIAMHIPPGNNIYNHSPFWVASDQALFLKLIKTYQPTIIGLLASHTHAEELKVIKTSPNQIIAGLYFTAALSTSHGNAPSIKTFYLSKNNKQWLMSNYKTFYFLQTGSGIKLKTLYNYQHYYCDHHETNLSACLDKITATPMKKYFSSGNPNFEGVIGSPNDIELIFNQP